MTAVCPVCYREQSEGLLCHACCSALEYELGDVPAIVVELDVTLSRQAKIGDASKSGTGWARERLPLDDGAIDPRWVLSNVLTTWARDVTDDTWRPAGEVDQAAAAARLLLTHVPGIRKHPAVVELVDEITDAIHLARRTVDRPRDRKFFGKCYAKQPGDNGQQITCLEEIWAHPHAQEVTCKVCGTEWKIDERREWLLDQAADLICTVREASSYLGEVGGIRVTQASIKGYVHRKRLSYRSGTTMIRLGDLLEILVDETGKRSA